MSVVEKNALAEQNAGLPASLGIVLRPFQEEATAAVLSAWDRGVQAPLISLPTASGKTIVFSEVLKRRLAEGSKKGLILVHTEELLQQALDKVRFVWPGVVLSEVKAGREDWSGQVVVASVQTLVRRVASIPVDEIDVVVTDECHHAVAPIWRAIYERFDGRPWNHLGVTATPMRTNTKESVFDIFTELVYSRSIFEQIVAGYLCALRGKAIGTGVDLDGLKTERGDFESRQLSKLLNTPARNRFVVEKWRELAENRKTIVFCVTIEHARAMADAFAEEGVASAVVSGETPKAERREIVHSLRDGPVLVVANVSVFSEGFDEPSVECIVMARPTLSRTLYVQCIGRGLRYYPGKKDCVLLDFVGNSGKHQMVSLRDLLSYYGMPKLAERLAGEAENLEEGEEHDVLLDPDSLKLLMPIEERMRVHENEINFFDINVFAWHQVGDDYCVPLTRSSVIVLKIEDDDRVQPWLVLPDAGDAGLKARICQPVALDMAFAHSNVQIWDFGDRWLAEKAASWRADSPTEGQAERYRRFSEKLALDPLGGVKKRTKGDYALALTFLGAESAMREGREISLDEARNEIRVTILRDSGVAGAVVESSEALRYEGEADEATAAFAKRLLGSLNGEYDGLLARLMKRYRLVCQKRRLVLLVDGEALSEKQVRLVERTIKKVGRAVAVGEMKVDVMGVERKEGGGRCWAPLARIKLVGI